MIRNDKIFYRVLTVSVFLCVALYAEEVVHFMHYGWDSPDNNFFTRDMSVCRPVPGKSADVECPIKGYGWARFRYNQKYHSYFKHNFIDFVDRIQ
jgi:hypothetical protein